MKLGEEGEAFFVFETSENIPEAMQTSPLVSPASSPPLAADGEDTTEPDFLDLDTEMRNQRSATLNRAGSDLQPKSRRTSNLSTLPHLHTPNNYTPLGGI